MIVCRSSLHASYFAGQTFKAHRLVLAACSPHFEQLFTPAAAHMAAQALSNNQFYVILDGTRADDLQILLQFMYRGETYLQVTTNFHLPEFSPINEFRQKFTPKLLEIGLI